VAHVDALAHGLRSADEISGCIHNGGAFVLLETTDSALQRATARAACAAAHIRMTSEADEDLAGSRNRADLFARRELRLLRKVFFETAHAAVVAGDGLQHRERPWRQHRHPHDQHQTRPQARIAAEPRPRSDARLSWDPGAFQSRTLSLRRGVRARSGRRPSAHHCAPLRRAPTPSLESLSEPEAGRAVATCAASSPRSSTSRSRARAMRLLMVPTATWQTSAASS